MIPCVQKRTSKVSNTTPPHYDLKNIFVAFFFVMTPQQFTFIAGLLFIVIGVVVFAVAQMSQDAARNHRVIANLARRQAITSGQQPRESLYQPGRINSRPSPMVHLTGSINRPSSHPSRPSPTLLGGARIIHRRGPSPESQTAFSTPDGDILSFIDFVEQAADSVQTVAGDISSASTRLQRTQDSVRRTAAAATAAAASTGGLIDSTLDAVSSGVLNGFIRSALAGSDETEFEEVGRSTTDETTEEESKLNEVD